MKVYSCHTPSHEILFDEYYSRTLPVSFENNPNLLNIAGNGDFKSSGFFNAISAKIKLIVESIERDFGSIIIWSDVDIVYLDVVVGRLEQVLADSPDSDVLFQREFAGNRVDVNTGFIVIRCNQRTQDFFRRLLANEELGIGKNEQEIVNEMLKSEAGISWELLPPAFYARSQGWPPPDDIALYHANCTAGADGVQRKIRQFKHLERHRRPKFLRRIVRAVSHLGAGRDREFP